ncbi:MAG: DEAD/DEAH box helicase [Verrucomicrobia bacterium]|nr:DEAD/DEAH box helicase [Verrucomicrobiota bacterium]
MEKRPFTELGLSPEILKAVEKMGFEEASPIQTAVIPVALTGRDVVGMSSTGSGKTAAFAIPAIERVDGHKKAVQVLILCPTRELAVQVSEESAKLAFFKRGVREVPIYGGQSYERQYRALAAGAQIVIGTPGRVMDMMERGALKLQSLAVVVLDEADRMLDMGFRDDIEKILSSVPETRQLLFFSATMPRAIQDLIGRYSKDPAWVKIESVAQNAPQVEQVWFEVDRRSKLEALTRLIDVNDFRYGIIFCSTKIMVDDLDEALHARGYQTDRLHGDLSQAQRDRVMDKFRRRAFEFLVATDVAARGLDVDDLEVVFNFDLPNDAEDYTHRIGRTGRAGRKGRAFTFVSGQELYKLQSMVRWARLDVRRGSIPSLDEVDEARTNVFFERIRATLDAKQFKPHDRMIDRLLDDGYASTDICSALIHLLQGGTSGASEKAPAPESKAKPAPAWAEKKAARPTASPEAPGETEAEREREDDDGHPAAPSRKTKYERPARTGREAGKATIFINVGRKQLITPGDIVGKIAGVTRLPATAVGAIDIHQRHTLADVAEDQVDLIIKKLTGIKMKGIPLAPMRATEAGPQNDNE